MLIEITGITKDEFALSEMWVMWDWKYGKLSWFLPLSKDHEYINKNI